LKVFQKFFLCVPNIEKIPYRLAREISIYICEMAYHINAQKRIRLTFFAIENAIFV
jgi:hypothetical protein